MATVWRSQLVTEVRECGHLEHLRHVKDAEIAAKLDNAYRRCRAMLASMHGQELEKKEVFAHLAPGVKRIALPVDFYKLKGVLVRLAESEEIIA